MKYQDLDVWIRSIDLTVNLYKLLKACRDFGFKDQITRSALSIPSNIAEGLERDSQKEKVRFLGIAKGSAGELMTQLIIAQRIEYLDTVSAQALQKECKEIAAMLAGLSKYLTRN